MTKLSGVGADAVFLGMLRPLAFSKRDVRAWLSPTGVIMCCGPMFSALTGIVPEEMVGVLGVESHVIKLQTVRSGPALWNKASFSGHWPPEPLILLPILCYSRRSVHAASGPWALAIIRASSPDRAPKASQTLAL